MPKRRKAKLAKMDIGAFKCHLDNAIGLVSEMERWTERIGGECYRFTHRTTRITLFTIEVRELKGGWKVTRLLDYPTRRDRLSDITTQTFDEIHPT